MTIQLDGRIFTGFHGRDSQISNLHALTYQDKINWIQYRFDLVFNTPFQALLKQESPDCFIWLCVFNLACDAIEALSSFRFTGSGRTRFNDFFSNYFKRGSTYQLTLYDPKPNDPWTAVTIADHLYKYFRSGLAHSFAIEWGGVRHIRDGAPNYLYAAPQIQGNCLGIDPNTFIDDFNHAMNLCFTELRSFSDNSPEARIFEIRFLEVFIKTASMV